MKKIEELGLYVQSGHSGYIGLFWGPSCAPHQCKGFFKVHHGNKGDYIWYNHTTYYL